MDTELKEMLKERAEEIRVEPAIPRPVLRRARRRRALSAAVAGVSAAIVVAGVVVGVQAAFREHPAPRPIHPGPSPTTAPSGAVEHFPGIWPVATRARLVDLEMEARANQDLTYPAGAGKAFTVAILGWKPGDARVSQLETTQGRFAHVTVENRALGGALGPLSAAEVYLQRFGAVAGRRIWLVTRVQSRIMNVGCPSPRQDVLESYAPIEICGSITQPPHGWTMTATLEYAGSELATSEAANGVDPAINGRSFRGTIHPTASDVGLDVTLAIRLFSGNTVLGIDVRRLQVQEARKVPGLPPLVARTRGAILAAARARSYSALAPLIDPKGFQFTFGKETNAIAYWKQQGFGPLRMMEALLKLPFTTEREGSITFYVWPSAYTMSPHQLRTSGARLRAELGGIYIDIDRMIRRWVGAGAYTGWRLGIDSHGKWVFFVSGP